MNKINFGKPSDDSNNLEQVWIDRSRLNGQKDLSFGELLKNALSQGDIDLKNSNKAKGNSRKNDILDDKSSFVDKIKKGNKIVLTKHKPNKKNFVGVYQTNFPKTRQGIENTRKTNIHFDQNERSFLYKKTEDSKKFKISKLSKQKDSEIMDNFLNKTLLSMMQEAYVNSENLENNKYKQRESLIGALDKKKLNEGDMVEGVVYEWSDSAKKYKVLVGKDEDSVAWAYISDKDEKKHIVKGDKVYFVVTKNSLGKKILKEYYPQEGDLNIGDMINLKFANVKKEAISNIIKDTKTGKLKTKKIGIGYIKIGLGEYIGIIKNNLLPKSYKPGKPLEVKIKEITKKGDRLLIKFDEDSLMEKSTQDEKK